MILNVFLFAAGFVMLIKGGDWFVDASVGIANRLDMPKLLVGATIVSIGTTLPEVMVSSMSALSGHSQVAYGNAIGSIICNTALISAITLMVVPQVVKRTTLIIPSIFFFLSALIYSIISYTTGYFSRTIGIIFLIIFVIYIVIAVYKAIKDPFDGNEDDEQLGFDQLWKNIIFLIIGAAIIAIGSKLLIDNGTEIAKSLGVPESVIALTMIALGTSLPELITAIQSIRKKQATLSIGNIIGANLFNIVLVGGMSITLNPFSVPTESKIWGYNSSLLLEIPLMLLVMIILVLPSIIKGKTYRYQGACLILIYISFVTFQFLK